MRRDLDILPAVITANAGGGGGTVYAAFTENIYNNFQLCTLNLSDGTLTAVGSRQPIVSLVGNNPYGLSLLKSGSKTYAGFVDYAADNFRLCTLNLSDGTLTAVGNKQSIRSLVGYTPAAVGLLKSGGTTYAGFADHVGRIFQLCTLNLSDGTLTAVGSKKSILSLVGYNPYGLSLLKSESTTYAGFVDFDVGNFRLCTLNLSNGKLTAVGNKQAIGSLVGVEPTGVDLLESGGTTYAGFVDRDLDNFRLCTLNLSDSTLTAVGSKQSISSLVGPMPFGLGLLQA